MVTCSSMQLSENGNLKLLSIYVLLLRSVAIVLWLLFYGYCSMAISANIYPIATGS